MSIARYDGHMTSESGSTPPGEDVFARVTWALRRADLAMQAVKEPPLRDVGLSGSLYALLANLQTTPGLTGAGSWPASSGSLRRRLLC